MGFFNFLKTGNPNNNGETISGRSDEDRCTGSFNENLQKMKDQYENTSSFTIHNSIHPDPNLLAKQKASALQNRNRMNGRGR